VGVGDGNDHDHHRLHDSYGVKTLIMSCSSVCFRRSFCGLGHLDPNMPVS
jgi:hypothetical protein